MNTKIVDFPYPHQYAPPIGAQDKNMVSYYINAINAIDKNPHQCLYLIDYKSGRFLYVSDNPLFLCNHTAEEVKDLGYAFYLNQVPAEDLEILRTIDKAGFDWYEQIEIKTRPQYTISYDFQLKQPHSNSSIMINHKLSPLEIMENGEIWLVLCSVSLSLSSSSGNIFIQKKGDQVKHVYNLKAKRWAKESETCLKDREKEILLLSAKGLTTHEIAKAMYISIETVKFHKRSLFQKLDVKNITEAVVKSINRNLL